MKKLMILILMITLSSCSGLQQNPDFDKNVELAKNWFATFTSEDYDATAALMSEDVEWQGCFYGSPVMNKVDAMTYMKGWHDAMENITYTPENYLPGVDPETGQLNGSVRTYGVWTGTNTASGKDFEILMYHYFTFNDEGKIINSGDFGDATGLIMAVAPDSAE
tara:strand:+ start:229 stop:720 length:492 start_codon:yes stop_codon:yes gene_type:complete